MAPNLRDSSLVFAIYNPAQSSKDRQIQRSAILSHAARVSHTRRRSVQRDEESSNKSTGGNLCEKRRSEKEHRSSSMTVTSKQTGYSLPPEILQGVSDPFDSMAIRITPEVSMLFGLWRAHNTSATASATRWIGRETLRLDFVLDNELHMKALLFLCSALLNASIVSESHNFQLKRLKYKQDCLQQLTVFVKSQGKKNKLLFFQALSRVFVAAVLSNEIVEAQIHANQLHTVVMAVDEDNLSNDIEQIFILGRTYYYDQRCALLHMRPPVLDPKVAIRLWEKYLKPFRQWLQHQNIASGAVQFPAFSKNLKELFTRLEEYIVIQCYGVRILFKSLPLPTLTCPILFEVELTSLFFSHLELIKSQLLEEVDNETKNRWQNEGILTLAVLAFFNCTGSVGNIFNLARRCAKGMQILREWLERTSNSESEVLYLWTYQGSQLWALYIGAMWERDSGVQDSGQTWFTVNLIQKVRELAIPSWTEFKKIISSFLHLPLRQESAGSGWFPGMDRAPADLKPGGQYQSNTEYFQKILFTN